MLTAQDADHCGANFLCRNGSGFNVQIAVDGMLKKCLREFIHVKRSCRIFFKQEVYFRLAVVHASNDSSHVNKQAIGTQQVERHNSL